VGEKRGEGREKEKATIVFNRYLAESCIVFLSKKGRGKFQFKGKGKPSV
jgi:hypothetical protein